MKRLAVMLSLLMTACGVEGPRGPQGIPGPSGADGEDGSGLAQVYTCTLVDTIGGLRLAFNSTRYEFDDGSVMTTCIVNDAATSYATTFMYRADQSGAATGSCLVVYDVDTSSEGRFEFSSRAGGTGTVKYVDPASPLNGRTQNLTCTKR